VNVICASEMISVNHVPFLGETWIFWTSTCFSVWVMGTFFLVETFFSETVIFSFLAKGIFQTFVWEGSYLPWVEFLTSSAVETSTFVWGEAISS